MIPIEQMDVINLISKVDGLPEAPIADPDEKYQLAVQFFANGCVTPPSFIRFYPNARLQ